jgi:succinoglycan biosynthesis protein ExoM
MSNSVHPAINGHLTVVVASLTRSRPIMLRSLLESWANMEQPDETTVQFFVLENDTRPKSQKIVTDIQTKYRNLMIHYHLEPRQGIATARNKALEEAKRLGAQVICFVDDDEEVSPSWLKSLVLEYRRTAAVAVGGPVIPKRPACPLGAEAEELFKAVERRSIIRFQRIAKKASVGDMRHITVSTGNCLYDLSALGRNHLRFDEGLQLSSGEDAKLSAEIVKAGLRIGWAEKAFVWETQPPERLKIDYIVRSSRDISSAYIKRKLYANFGTFIFFATSAALRMVSIPILALLSCISFRFRFLLLQNFGWLQGFRIALTCRVLETYANTTGE